MGDVTPAEQEIIRRLAEGEDPWTIDPEYGCTNPLTGYFPSAEVEAFRRAHPGVHRRCAECGISVLPGDGGVLAYGRRFCSEACADDYEDRISTQDDTWPEALDE